MGIEKFVTEDMQKRFEFHNFNHALEVLTQASPLYFSFVRMLSTVPEYQTGLPAGDGIPRSVSFLAMPEGINPSRKSL